MQPYVPSCPTLRPRRFGLQRRCSGGRPERKTSPKIVEQADALDKRSWRHLDCGRRFFLLWEAKPQDRSERVEHNTRPAVRQSRAAVISVPGRRLAFLKIHMLR